MFFWLVAPLLSYNWFLIASAVVPAIFLLVKVYTSDKLERESPYLIMRLVVGGIVSTFIALVSERLFGFLLDISVPRNTMLYNIILYFIVVAFSEEGAKYCFLRRKTWRSCDFNCQYDGVVYAVAVSLGFAMWENISYVTLYGFGTALVRAVTAIPGHACFGVFMGVFYGLAKANDYMGKTRLSKFHSALSVLVPALLHGAYDFCASIPNEEYTWLFLAFVVILFALSLVLVRLMSRNDRYIRRSPRNPRNLSR